MKLYSAKNFEIRETLTNSSILSNGAELNSLFDDAKTFLGNSYGWLTIFSEYPYFDVTTTMENEYGSICYEHSF